MTRDIPMSVRRLIVEVDLDGLNVTEFCRQHGVSTWFFYQLRKRYAAEGEAGLEPRSRAARTVANRTPDWVEDLIVDLRKSLSNRLCEVGVSWGGYHPSGEGDSERVERSFPPEGSG
ncbi:MAG: helix-turn-helix domain-containing protein, partial [Acidimicrobiia bacterium]|nr:helix-turn-helix domain-containing protein [Acidimicrobiia bacterium]